MTRKPRKAASWAAFNRYVAVDPEDDPTRRFTVEALTDLGAAVTLLQKAIWTTTHTPRTDPMLKNLAEIQRFLATHYLRGYEPRDE